VKAVCKFGSGLNETPPSSLFFSFSFFPSTYSQFIRELTWFYVCATFTSYFCSFPSHIRAQLAEFCVDQELMTSACAQYPHALKYASEELQVPLTYCWLHRWSSLSYCSTDSFFSLFLLSPSTSFHSRLCALLAQNNKDLVLVAVQSFGFALVHASGSLRDDEEVCVCSLRSQ